MYPYHSNLRNKLEKPSLWWKDSNRKSKYTLKEQSWDNIGKQYKKLYYIYPHYAPENFVKLSIFASKYKMNVNFGYFARIDKNKASSIKKELRESILNNTLEKDAIYYINDKEILELVQKNQSQYNLITIEDDLQFIVPNKE